MQRFRFRLNRVLEWYRKKCRQEENHLVACLARVHEVEQKIESLRAERDTIDRDLLRCVIISAPDLHNLSRYRLRAAKEELDFTEERLRRVAAGNDQRARVQRAQQRVRLLEKLRDRRLEEYTLAEGRELEAVAADAYLARWSQSRPRA